MKPYLAIFLLSIFAYAAYCQIKDSVPKTKGSINSIRYKDFTQLIGSATSGISLSYNADKTTLNGSFGVKADSGRPIPWRPWLQVTPSIGTSTSLFTLGQQAPQPDFSLSASLIFVVSDIYGYDESFPYNYDILREKDTTKKVRVANSMGVGVVGEDALLRLPAGIYKYSAKLKTNLRSDNPRLKKNDSLIVLKSIDWVAIKPEWGGSSYTFYDGKKPFDQQITKPYFQNTGISISLNHYWYANFEDVRWQWPYKATIWPFFYYSLAVRFGTNNNSDILKKVTINDVTATSTNPANNAQRQIVKSTSAYQGNFQQFSAFTPSFEILGSIAKSFAFDFFGSYNYVTTKGTGITNYGALAEGVYFYTNSNSSKINIGVYYQHSLNVKPAKEIIGLKTKIPVNW